MSDSLNKNRVLECDYAVLRLAGFVSGDDNGNTSDRVVACIRKIISGYMDAGSMVFLLHGFREGARKGFKPERDIKTLKGAYGTDIGNYLKVLSLLITVLFADGGVSEPGKSRLLHIASSFGIENDEAEMLIRKMDSGHEVKHRYTKALMTLIGWVASADGEMTQRQKEYADTVIGEVGDVTSDYFGDFVRGFDLGEAPVAEINTVSGFLAKSFENEFDKYNNVRVGCLCLLIGGIREDRRPPSGEAYRRLQTVAKALGFSGEELDTVIRHLEEPD